MLNLSVQYFLLNIPVFREYLLNMNFEEDKALITTFFALLLFSFAGYTTTMYRVFLWYMLVALSGIVLFASCL